MRAAWIAVMLFAAGLAGCASVQHQSTEIVSEPIVERPAVSFETDQFGERPAIIAIADIYRFSEAEEINIKLAQRDGGSPFDWLHAGHDAYTNGDFRGAISFYQKAVDQAPYLHESYAGMAKAHYMLGNRVSAKRELLKAQQYSYRKSFQSLYQAKLIALASEY